MLIFSQFLDYNIDKNAELDSSLYTTSLSSSKQWINFFFNISLIIPNIGFFLAFYYVVKRSYIVSIKANKYNKNIFDKNNITKNTVIITNDDLVNKTIISRFSEVNLDLNSALDKNKLTILENISKNESDNGDLDVTNKNKLSVNTVSKYLDE